MRVANAHEQATPHGEEDERAGHRSLLMSSSVMNWPSSPAETTVIVVRVAHEHVGVPHGVVLQRVRHELRRLALVQNARWKRAERREVDCCAATSAVRDPRGWATTAALPAHDHVTAPASATIAVSKHDAGRGAACAMACCSTRKPFSNRRASRLGAQVRGRPWARSVRVSLRARTGAWPMSFVHRAASQLTLQGLAAGSRAAHADEQPRSRCRRAAAGSRRLRRHRQGGAQLGGLPRDRRASCAALENDETLLVQSGKRGRRVPHARGSAARADRELEPRRQVGDLGALPRARGEAAS